MSISHVREFSVCSTLPTEPVNLYVDDIRFPYQTYSDLGNNIGIPPSEWTLVRTVEDAKVLLALGLVKVISFDHDLGTGPTGYDLIKWIEEHNHWHVINDVYVHSANPVGAKNIKEFADRYFYQQKSKHARNAWREYLGSETIEFWNNCEDIEKELGRTNDEIEQHLEGKTFDEYQNLKDAEDQFKEKK